MRVKRKIEEKKKKKKEGTEKKREKKLKLISREHRF